eukprot:SAG25_NODE_15_length_24441_cov_175.207288_14_plen_202_part_00
MADAADVASADAAQQPRPRPRWLAVGRRVLVHGLQSDRARQYNGRVGVLCRYRPRGTAAPSSSSSSTPSSSLGRWAVRLDDGDDDGPTASSSLGARSLAVREANLRPWLIIDSDVEIPSLGRHLGRLRRCDGPFLVAVTGGSVEESSVAEGILVRQSLMPRLCIGAGGSSVSPQDALACGVRFVLLGVPSPRHIITIITMD